MIVTRPPMGWNSWNTFGRDISDSLIRETAEAFIDTGLRDAGYEYVVIDDCWAEKERDEATGELVASRAKFPEGMKSLADFVHGKGLKFGMYSCAGVRTCAGYPGSFDHEFLDAATFAGWGVDFLKYDYCFIPPTASGPLLFQRIGVALETCGRDILFSGCSGGLDDTWTWIRSSGAHMYRSTHDIHDNFQSFTEIAMSQKDKFGFSGENCYNDMDMLTVGMYGKGNVGTTGCTDADYRTQFTLWCLYGAPLMLGCDVRNMMDAARELVTNKALIALDQDEAARPPIWQQHPWNANLKTAFRHLSNGEYAVAFFNFGERAGGAQASFEAFGIPASAHLKMVMTDLFTGEELTVREYFDVSVAPHASCIFRGKLER